MTLRVINTAPLRARYQGAQSDPGKRPELRWLKISQLRVDPRYQREIGERGQRNVLSIAHHFKWCKFSVVVVAPIGADLYAIVDGQCHTTSAALREFDEVPCVIIDADECEQADAFVAINANVTAMSPLQLHAARLAAGSKAAAELTEACGEAGVTICRYPVPANKIKPGETLAVAMLQSSLEKFGRDVLVAALCCITRTRRGNPGMIRKAIVQALCAVLEAERSWLADRPRLIFAMQTFDFAAQFTAASSKSIETGDTVSSTLVEAIAAHLDGKVEMAQPAAATPAPAAAKLQAAPPAPAPRPSAPQAAATHGPLSIGSQEISFNGRKVRVVPRAASLVGVLAKAMPNCVGDEFIIARIWSARPGNAIEMLDALVHDLKILKQIGLEVRTQRGIGRQLVEVA